MPFEGPIEGIRTAEEIAAARAELERKSTEELFAATLEGEYDDDAAWEAVTVLRLRGTPEVFEVARRYCESENPKARARGLGVLAQLGAGKPDAERPFMADSVSIAIRHLRDSDPEIVRSAAWALSHLGTQLAVAALIDLEAILTQTSGTLLLVALSLGDVPKRYAYSSHSWKTRMKSFAIGRHLLLGQGISWKAECGFMPTRRKSAPRFAAVCRIHTRKPVAKRSGAWLGVKILLE